MKFDRHEEFDELALFYRRLARRAGSDSSLRRVLEELARDEDEYRRRRTGTPKKGNQQ